MSLPFKHIAILCGPQSAAPDYTHAAEELGFSMGRRAVSVAAGGHNELLSKFTRAASCENPDVVAYFAARYDDRAPMKPPLPQKLVPDAAERQARVLDKADLLMTLPGEIDTWCSFGQSGRPVIIVNMNGQFKHAKSIMEQAVSDGKIGHNSVRNVHWSRCVEEAMDIFDDLQMRALAL